jgi:hypothetical protein
MVDHNTLILVFNSAVLYHQCTGDKLVAGIFLGPEQPKALLR